MATATARSTTLPRRTKSLNPLSTTAAPSGEQETGASPGDHDGARLTVTVDVVDAAARRAAVGGSTATSSTPASPPAGSADGPALAGVARTRAEPATTSAESAPGG